MTPACPREPEVVAALRPDGTLPIDDAVTAHVEHCAVCAEVMAVAALLRRDDEMLEQSLSLPSSGQVWWRAAVRARIEATQAVQRPIAFTQALTVAVALGVVGAVLALTWPLLQRVKGEAVASVSAHVDTAMLDVVPPVMDAMQRGLPLAIGAAIAVIGAPLLVLYFALAGDD